MAIEQPADTTYSDKEVLLDFELILDNNCYTNLKSPYLCFPVRFRKLSNTAQNLDLSLFPVNNFLAQWIKEIDISKYGTNKFLIPTTTPQESYRYSKAILKHLPENDLKMIEKNLLYSTKPVIIRGNEDRRSHTNNNEANRTDANLEDRENKFDAQIDNKYVYRVPLKNLCDLGKLNFPKETDLKICCTLQTDMKKLSELKKKVTAIGVLDAQLVFP